MELKKSLILLIIAVIVVAGVATYYFSNLNKVSKVVVYAYNDAITGIDPSVEDDTGLVVLGVVYEPLLYYNPIKNEFKPALAVNWTSNEDMTEWVFKLRQGVVFHDGTPFNATAVKISVERAKKIYENSGRGLGYIWEAVEEIEIIDEYTIKFKLSYPQRLDIMASASYAAYIFSPSVLSKVGTSDLTDPKIEEWFNNGNAAGTGPYVLELYKPDSEIRLRKFDRWWGWREVNNPDAPDVVVIRIMTEPQAQYNAILSKNVHIASSIPRVYVSELEKRSDVKVIKTPTFHNYLLFFNVKRYPTNITEFRKAVLYAINLTEAIQISMLNYATPGSGIVPRGFPGFVEDLQYRYNKSLAEQYLAESGVKTPASIQLLYQVDYEELNKLAQLLKTRLGEIGIDLELVPVTWSQLKDIAKGVWDNPDQTPHIIIADWWPTIASPYDFLYTMFSSESKEWNFAGYENPEFDNLVNQAFYLEGSNYTKAMEMYTQAQRIIFEEAVAINLWDEVKPFIVVSNIEVPEDAFNPLYMYVIRFEIVRVKG